ncbi:MAG: glycosyltransferase family 9 protein, partial [Planctomycetota bacterium]
MMPPSLEDDAPRKTLVVLPNWVGDGIMATAALGLLARHVDPASIHLLGRPVILKTLAGLPYATNGIAVAGRTYRSRIMQSFALRRKRFDRVISLPNSTVSGVCARIISPQTVGTISAPLRSMCIRRPVQYVDVGGVYPSTIQKYLQTISTAILGESITGDARRHFLQRSSRLTNLQLHVSEVDRNATDALMKKCGLGTSQRPVVINTCSAWGETRELPMQLAVDVARQIHDRLSLPVVFHAGPGEQQRVAEIVDRADRTGVVSMGVADSLPMGLSRGLIQRASAVISSDSGVRWIAVALQRPTLSIY